MNQGGARDSPGANGGDWHNTAIIGGPWEPPDWAAVLSGSCSPMAAQSGSLWRRVAALSYQDHRGRFIRLASSRFLRVVSAACFLRAFESRRHSASNAGIITNPAAIITVLQTASRSGAR